MRAFHACQRLLAVFGLCVALNSLYTSEASAHVKWFCAYDVAGQPRGLYNVLCPDFELLVATALLLLLAGYLLEASVVGTALISALNRVTHALRDNTEVLMRAGCGFFFVALWTMGGVILTPELTTAAAIIPWAQLGLAACLIWRQTLPIAALGIFVLFVFALFQYGLFHLMDYPIFLGIAGYLALVGLQRNFFGVRPVDVLRYSAAITLMWASVEKWAYPQWTFPLLATHPEMTLGYAPEFYMRAAGMVEFTLSFALIMTPLVRRTAAIVLCSMFASAIFEFGKIDAIGHAPIIATLFAIIGDDFARAHVVHGRLGIKNYLDRFKLTISKWDLILVPAGYCAALASFLAIYYVVHAALFGTHIA